MSNVLRSLFLYSSLWKKCFLGLHGIFNCSTLSDHWERFLSSNLQLITVKKGQSVKSATFLNAPVGKSLSPLTDYCDLKKMSISLVEPPTGFNKGNCLSVCSLYCAEPCDKVLYICVIFLLPNVLFCTIALRNNPSNVTAVDINRSSSSKDEEDKRNMNNNQIINISLQ